MTGVLLSTQGAELLPTPPPVASLRAVDRPEGPAEEIDKIFLKTCFGVLLLTWVKGLVLVYASFVKGPHRSVASYFMIKSSVRRCRWSREQHISSALSKG
jgi:hypothetical protein